MPTYKPPNDLTRRAMGSNNSTAPLTVSGAQRSGIGTRGVAPTRVRSRNLDAMRQAQQTLGGAQQPQQQPQPTTQATNPMVQRDAMNLAAMSFGRNQGPTLQGGTGPSLAGGVPNPTINPTNDPTGLGSNMPVNDPTRYNNYASLAGNGGYEEDDGGGGGHIPDNDQDVVDWVDAWGDRVDNSGQDDFIVGNLNDNLNNTSDRIDDDLHVGGGRYGDLTDDDIGTDHTEVTNQDEEDDGVDPNGAWLFGQNSGMDPFLSQMWADYMQGGEDPSQAQELLSGQVQSQLGDTWAAQAARMGAYGGGQSGALAGMQGEAGRQAAMDIAQGQFDIRRDLRRDTRDDLTTGTAALHEQQRINNEQTAFDIQEQILRSAMDDPGIESHGGVVSDVIGSLLGDQFGENTQRVIDAIMGDEDERRWFNENFNPNDPSVNDGNESSGGLLNPLLEPLFDWMQGN